MSTRISLAFCESVRDDPADTRPKIVRLVAGVRFRRSPSGWTKSYEAIVDTGCTVSVIPEYIWRQIEARRLSDVSYKIGLTGRVLTVELAEVESSTTDDTKVTPPMPLLAYLSRGSSTLLLLGMHQYLMRSIVHCDYPAREAYLEFP